MWTAVGQISTSVSLVAFLAAVLVIGYQAYLRHKIRALEILPPRDRIVAVERQLNAFDIKADNLTDVQQFDLAVGELKLRSRKLLALSIVVVVVALIFGAISLSAIASFDTSYRQLKEYKSELSTLDARIVSTKSMILAAQNQLELDKSNYDFYAPFRPEFGKEQLAKDAHDDMQNDRKKISDYNNELREFVGRRARIEELIHKYEQKRAE